MHLFSSEKNADHEIGLWTVDWGAAAAASGYIFEKVKLAWKIRDFNNYDLGKKKSGLNAAAQIRGHFA